MSSARRPVSRTRRAGSGRPAPREGRPLWLFLTEPGLAALAASELKFIGAVAKKAQFARLHLRNHDLLVLPDVVVQRHDAKPRLVTNVLKAPVFGRGDIGPSAFDQIGRAHV